MSLQAIFWKDARRELRGKETIQAGLVLVLLFFVLDLFAFPTLRGEPRAAAAALWAPLLYACAALAGRGMATESDRGTLDLLRGAPVPMWLHGVSRTVVNTVLTLLLAMITLGCAAALFGVPVTARLVLVIALGAFGLAVLGSLVGAIAAQARSREVLLPILLVPAAAPLLQAGVAATLRVLAGDASAAVTTPLLIMAGYDLIACGLAVLLWPLLLEGE